VVLLVEVVLRAAVVIVVIPYDQVVALAAVCQCGRCVSLMAHHLLIPSYIFTLIYSGPTSRFLLVLLPVLLPGDVVSTVTFGPQVNHRMTPHVLVCVCMRVASERV
jgi:hypothetical protein